MHFLCNALSLAGHSEPRTASPFTTFSPEQSGRPKKLRIGIATARSALLTQEAATFIKAGARTFIKAGGARAVGLQRICALSRFPRCGG